MRLTTRLIVTLFAAFALTAAAGCTRTQEDFKPRALGAKSSPSLDAVTGAVLRAGQKQGWQMTMVRPGLVQARNEWGGGKHNIVVDVTYSTSEYSIKYVSSKNLKKGDGTIHRSYNRLTNRLYDAIREETQKL